MAAKDTETYERMCEAIMANNPRRREGMERVLRIVRETGPRSFKFLAGLAGSDAATVEKMVCIGMLEQIGHARGAVYGTPAQAAQGRRRRAA
jgi:hypothetical protein